MRLAGLLLLALAGCAAAPAQEAAPPARPTLVSLNPCTDAILAEVADPAQILAISSYSHDPAASSMSADRARQFAATRGTVEELARLRPELVVDGNFTPPATRAALARLDLRLEQVPIAPTVEASIAQVRRLAALAGQPARGEALAARIAAAVAEAASDSAIPAVVWQSGGIVAGEGTLIDDLLRRTGFSNAAAARGLNQASYLPLEAMLASPPRVILAAGGDNANEDRLLRHPALAGLVQTRRARIDPVLLWCGGPTIIRTAARLRQVRLSLGAAPGSRPEDSAQTQPRMRGT